MVCLRFIFSSVLAASLLIPSYVRAQTSAKPQLVSIRYGYALTFAPDWHLIQGDCAPYALSRSPDGLSSFRIAVTRGLPSTASLLQAEARTLRLSGNIRGEISYGTLPLHAVSVHTALAVTVSQSVSSTVLVAGVTHSQYTYLLVYSIRNTTSSSAGRAVKLGQQILETLHFARPAAAGSFSCIGKGVSQKRAITATGTPAGRPATATVIFGQNSTSTPVPVHTFTAAATQIATAIPALTVTNTPTGQPSFTATVSPSPSSTIPPLPTSTSSWTVTPTWTPTPTALATSTGTATATQTPVSGSVPTSGSTDNGCAITADQAAGELHLLAVLNADRAAAGVAPLALLSTLSVASRDHSCDMGLHSALNHTGSDGSSFAQRITSTGTIYTAAAENIGMAQGYGINGGVDLDDQMMMAEPLTEGNHHWNIVNSAYHRVGLGVINLSGVVWITEDFVN